MIELSGVTKHFGDRAAVDQVSLNVARGEICALVGTSGSGKSTTLRMINRLIEKDAGTIRIDGVDVDSQPVVELRRRIGYVIQSIGLFPHWSVARNVATVPALLGWPAAKANARVDELLALVGLDPAIYRDRSPHQLSGGQQQRVGFARALAADPDVLLMDEPFGAVDPVTRDSLQSELLRIHAATAKTIVLVTHDIDEAIRLASQIAVMDLGRIVQQGRPRDLLANPADGFVREFVGGTRRGLRLLKVSAVGDLVQAGPVPDGVPVPASTALDDALAQMIAQSRTALAVADDNGAVLGIVRLEDLVLRAAA
ncbi:ABC transporter ATP-binding protein [Oleomonas cavernae]|uniref:ABC transporter ATP-binding protein n=1 Tax=Oleomonas cavernae TaxID=2320859 RepID=A0A418WT13_9PROT|nr:ABC transporter ATP-binding protein [Oleomonas cavernae]RJF94412.1 ABC transporter ATP-binding protein [Oleomonas cavernae]